VPPLLSEFQTAFAVTENAVDNAPRYLLSAEAFAKVATKHELHNWLYAYKVLLEKGRRVPR
jgi:hypothetical protein